jgi:hypothetical protein
MPPYYDSIGVFDLYDWNGGINSASIFYANFGIIGMVAYGLLVGYYIRITIFFLKSSRTLKQVAGYFMFGNSLPVFWYELIQIIKPLIFILVLYLTTRIIQMADHTHVRSMGNFTEGME